MTCSPLEKFAIVLLVSKRIHRFRTSKKENILCATPDYLFQLPWFLRCHINTRLGISIDIRGVDYPFQKRRFGVVYHLPSIQYNSCIRIRIGVDEITSTSSVISISPSAGRWEREVWDTSGLLSSNYHDLRRILTDYGFEGHPLRKDFPLSGYAEVRYDDSEKRVVSEPIELTQEFRYSDLASPWRLMPSRYSSSSLTSSVARNLSLILPKRNFCSSGESSESEGESSDLDSGTLTERWSDQVATLKSVSASLKEGGLARENHLRELNRVGRELDRDEIADIEWVVKDAAKARQSQNGGIDPAASQVQSLLAKTEIARNVAHFLRNDSILSDLSKDPLKRNAPGEGEARAAELNGLLDNWAIPAVSDVIIAYGELRENTANEASNGSDSAGDSGSSDTDDDDASGGDGWI